MTDVPRGLGLLALALLLSGCALGKTSISYEFPPDYAGHDEPASVYSPAPYGSVPRGTATGRVSVRVVTEQELSRVSAKDPQLSPSAIKQILSKMNARAPYYIDEDIKAGRPIKAPDDYEAFKDWTPLPRALPEVAGVPKFILIAKDVHYLGWYANGRMVGDTYICVGKEDDWTRAGLHLVRERDANHVSRSYTNAYGVPAPMPYALRAYEHVWIHTGDIERGNCSHGCINLPLMPSKELFAWANVGTPVLIVNSLKEVRPVLAQDRSRMLCGSGQVCPGRKGDE